MTPAPAFVLVGCDLGGQIKAAMQPPPTPRRHARALLRLLLIAALCLAALLAFVTSSSSSPAAADALRAASSPARALLLVPPRRHRALPLTDWRDDVTATVPPDLDAVLLPGWEVLVVLHPGDDQPGAGNYDENATCAFPGGVGTVARFLGRMPTSGRRAYTCTMPPPERRHMPFRAPRLLLAGGSSYKTRPMPQASMKLRWSGRLVYDAAPAGDGTGDVLVFARGVNPRQGVNRDAADIRCVYSLIGGGGEGGVVASLPAATSAQQVFRCPAPPPMSIDDGKARHLRVTLSVAGQQDPIPSMATYSSSRPTPPPPPLEKKRLICACTMVRDVGKFLREWAAYHAAVGVDRFYLYDNGSGDDLAAQVHHLRTAAGLDVSAHIWPWPKTQEAGFSHAAAAHAAACEWMAFVDVDEFIFAPAWAARRRPAASMLRSVVAAAAPDVGQLTLGCKDFGPSGRARHPAEGVTQGYTCRRRAEERHKSLVRLAAVGRALANSVHHFELRPGFRWERSGRGGAGVNHYKYQAWGEFKAKFRRRVSSYVADWTEPVNQGSRDRTPGLGFEAVEPDGWANRFCDVQDTLLRDATRRWFGVGFSKLLRAAQGRELDLDLDAPPRITATTSYS